LGCGGKKSEMWWPPGSVGKKKGLKKQKKKKRFLCSLAGFKYPNLERRRERSDG